MHCKLSKPKCTTGALRVGTLILELNIVSNIVSPDIVLAFLQLFSLVCCV